MASLADEIYDVIIDVSYRCADPIHAAPAPIIRELRDRIADVLDRRAASIAAVAEPRKEAA